MDDKKEQNSNPNEKNKNKNLEKMAKKIFNKIFEPNVQEPQEPKRIPEKNESLIKEPNQVSIILPQEKQKEFKTQGKRKTNIKEKKEKSQNPIYILGNGILNFFFFGILFFLIIFLIYFFNDFPSNFHETIDIENRNIELFLDQCRITLNQSATGISYLKVNETYILRERAFHYKYLLNFQKNAEKVSYFGLSGFSNEYCDIKIFLAINNQFIPNKIKISCNNECFVKINFKNVTFDHLEISTKTLKINLESIKTNFSKLNANDMKIISDEYTENISVLSNILDLHLIVKDKIPLNVFFLNYVNDINSIINSDYINKYWIEKIENTQQTDKILCFSDQNINSCQKKMNFIFEIERFYILETFSLYSDKMDQQKLLELLNNFEVYFNEDDQNTIYNIAQIVNDEDFIIHLNVLNSTKSSKEYIKVIITDKNTDHFLVSTYCLLISLSKYRLLNFEDFNLNLSTNIDYLDIESLSSELQSVFHKRLVKLIKENLRKKLVITDNFSIFVLTYEYDFSDIELAFRSNMNIIKDSKLFFFNWIIIFFSTIFLSIIITIKYNKSVKKDKMITELNEEKRINIFLYIKDKNLPLKINSLLNLYNNKWKWKSDFVYKKIDEIISKKSYRKQGDIFEYFFIKKKEDNEYSLRTFLNITWFSENGKLSQNITKNRKLDLNEFIKKYENFCFIKKLKILDPLGSDFLNILKNRNIVLIENEKKYDFFIVGLSFVNMAFINILDIISIYMIDENFDYLNFFIKNFCVLNENSNLLHLSVFEEKFYYFCEKNGLQKIALDPKELFKNYKIRFIKKKKKYMVQKEGNKKYFWNFYFVNLFLNENIKDISYIKKHKKFFLNNVLSTDKNNSPSDILIELIFMISFFILLLTSVENFFNFILFFYPTNIYEYFPQKLLFRFMVKDNSSFIIQIILIVIFIITLFYRHVIRNAWPLFKSQQKRENFENVIKILDNFWFNSLIFMGVSIIILYKSNIYACLIYLNIYSDLMVQYVSIQFFFKVFIEILLILYLIKKKKNLMILYKKTFDGIKNEILNNFWTKLNENEQISKKMEKKNRKFRKDLIEENFNILKKLIFDNLIKSKIENVFFKIIQNILEKNKLVIPEEIILDHYSKNDFPQKKQLLNYFRECLIFIKVKDKESYNESLKNLFTHFFNLFSKEEISAKIHLAIFKFIMIKWEQDIFKEKYPFKSLLEIYFKEDKNFLKGFYYIFKNFYDSIVFFDIGNTGLKVFEKDTFRGNVDGVYNNNLKKLFQNIFEGDNIFLDIIDYLPRNIKFDVFFNIANSKTLIYKNYSLENFTSMINFSSLRKKNEILIKLEKLEMNLKQITTFEKYFFSFIFSTNYFLQIKKIKLKELEKNEKGIYYLNNPLSFNVVNKNYKQEIWFLDDPIKLKNIWCILKKEYDIFETLLFCDRIISYNNPLYNFLIFLYSSNNKKKILKTFFELFKIQDFKIFKKILSKKIFGFFDLYCNYSRKVDIEERLIFKNVQNMRKLNIKYYSRIDFNKFSNFVKTIKNYSVRRFFKIIEIFLSVKFGVLNYFDYFVSTCRHNRKIEIEKEKIELTRDICELRIKMHQNKDINTNRIELKKEMKLFNYFKDFYNYLEKGQIDNQETKNFFTINNLNLKYLYQKNLPLNFKKEKLITNIFTYFFKKIKLSENELFKFAKSFLHKSKSKNLVLIKNQLTNKYFLNKAEILFSMIEQQKYRKKFSEQSVEYLFHKFQKLYYFLNQSGFSRECSFLSFFYYFFFESNFNCNFMEFQIICLKINSYKQYQFFNFLKTIYYSKINQDYFENLKKLIIEKYDIKNSEILKLFNYNYIKILHNITNKKTLKIKDLNLLTQNNYVSLLISFLHELKNKDKSIHYYKNILKYGDYFFKTYKLNIKEIFIIYNLINGKFKVAFVESFSKMIKNPEILSVTITLMLLDNKEKYINNSLISNILKESLKRFAIFGFSSVIYLQSGFFQKGEEKLALKLLNSDLYDKCYNGTFLMIIFQELIILKNFEICEDKKYDEINKASIKKRVKSLTDFFGFNFELFDFLSNPIKFNVSYQRYLCLNNDREILYLNLFLYENFKNFEPHKLEFFFDFYYHFKINKKLGKIRETDNYDRSDLKKIKRFFLKKLTEYQDLMETLFLEDKIFKLTTEIYFQNQKSSFYPIWKNLINYVLNINEDSNLSKNEYMELEKRLLNKILIKKWQKTTKDKSILDLIASLSENEENYNKNINSFFFNHENKEEVYFNKSFYLHNFLFFVTSEIFDLIEKNDYFFTKKKKKIHAVEQKALKIDIFLIILLDRLKTLEKEKEENRLNIILLTKMLCRMMEKSLFFFSKESIVNMNSFYIYQFFLSFGILLNEEETILFSSSIIDPINIIFLIYKTCEINSNLRKKKVNFLKVFREIDEEDQFIIKIFLLKKIHEEEQDRKSINMLFSKFEYRKEMKYNDDFSYNLFCDFDSIIRKFRRLLKGESILHQFWLMKSFTKKITQNVLLNLLSKCQKFLRDSNFLKLKIIEHNFLKPKFHKLISYQDLFRIFYGFFPYDLQNLNQYRIYWENYFAFARKFPILDFSFEKFYENFDKIIKSKLRNSDELKKKVRFILNIRKLKNNFNEEDFYRISSDLNLTSNYDYLVIILKLLVSNDTNDIDLIFNLFNIESKPIKIIFNIINLMNNENKIEIADYFIQKMDFPNILYEDLKSLTLLFLKPKDYLSEEKNYLPLLKLMTNEKGNRIKNLLKLNKLFVNITKISDRIFNFSEYLKTNFIEFLNIFLEDLVDIDKNFILVLNNNLLSDTFEAFLNINARNHYFFYINNKKVRKNIIMFNHENMAQDLKYFMEFGERFINNNLDHEYIKNFLNIALKFDNFSKFKWNFDDYIKKFTNKKSINIEKTQEKDKDIKNICQSDLDKSLKKTNFLDLSNNIKTSTKFKTEDQLSNNRKLLTEENIFTSTNKNVILAEEKEEILNIYSEIILLVNLLDCKDLKNFLENLNKNFKKLSSEISINIYFYLLLLNKEEIDSDLKKDTFLWQILNLNMKNKKTVFLKNEILKDINLEKENINLEEKLENAKNLEIFTNYIYHQKQNINLLERFDFYLKKYSIEITDKSWLNDLSILINKEKQREPTIIQEYLVEEEEFEYIQSLSQILNLPYELEKTILEGNFDPEKVFKNFEFLKSSNLKKMNFSHHSLIKFFILPLYFILEFVFPELSWKKKNVQSNEEEQILENFTKRFNFFFLFVDFFLSNFSENHPILERMQKMRFYKEQFYHVNKTFLEIFIKPYNTYPIIGQIIFKLIKKSPSANNISKIIERNIEMLKQPEIKRFFENSQNIICILNKKIEKEKLDILVYFQIDILKKFTNIKEYFQIPLDVLFNMLTNKKTFIREILSKCGNQAIKKTLKKQLHCFLIYNKLIKSLKFFSFNESNDFFFKSREDLITIKMFYLEDIIYLLDVLDIKFNEFEVAHILLNSKKSIFKSENNYIDLKQLFKALENYLEKELEKKYKFDFPIIIIVFILFEIVDWILSFFMISNDFRKDQFFAQYMFTVFHLSIFFFVLLTFVKIFFRKFTNNTRDKKKELKRFIYEKLKYNL